MIVSPSTMPASIIESPGHFQRVVLAAAEQVRPGTSIARWWSRSASIGVPAAMRP
jgi:hypothetical protein